MKLLIKFNNIKHAFRNMSIATSLSLMLAVIIGISSAVAGLYAVKLVAENKRYDAWAIIFLELENRANELVSALEKADSIDDAGQDIALSVDKTLSLIRGHLPVIPELKDLGLDEKTFNSTNRFTLVQYAGETFIATFRPHLLKLKRFPLTKWLQNSEKSSVMTRYAISHEGVLLASSSNQISQRSYVNRGIVQQFIKSNMREGQLEFSEKGTTYYGFYYDIPESNIVLFAEVPKDMALGDTALLWKKYLGAFTLIVILAMVALQIPIHRITKKIEERERDLMHQLEAYRIPGFATNFNTSPDSKLDIVGAQLLGEKKNHQWLRSFYDKTSKTTVIAVAEKFNDGVNSDFFFELLNQLFNRTASNLRMNAIEEDLNTFIIEANRILFTLGGGLWRASAVIVMLDPATESASIAQSGRTLVALSEHNNGKTSSAKFIGRESEPIGINNTCTVENEKINFSNTATMWICAGQLRNTNPLANGDSGLIELISKSSAETAREQVRELLRHIRDERSAEEFRADIGLVAARRAA